MACQRIVLHDARVTRGIALWHASLSPGFHRFLDVMCNHVEPVVPQVGKPILAAAATRRFPHLDHGFRSGLLRQGYGRQQ